MHGQDTSGDELSVLPDAEVPRLYPHHVVKHELQVQPAFHTHLGKHGFAVLGHHAALVTVEGHEVAVECLLGVLEHVVQLCGTPLKNASEVAWYQGPANGISLWSILQAESDGQHGVIFKELSCESIPPEIVTLLCPVL